MIIIDTGQSLWNSQVNPPKELGFMVVHPQIRKIHEIADFNPQITGICGASSPQM
jgi:hypothetical protein